MEDFSSTDVTFITGSTSNLLEIGIVVLSFRCLLIRKCRFRNYSKPIHFCLPFSFTNNSLYEGPNNHLTSLLLLLCLIQSSTASQKVLKGYKSGRAISLINQNDSLQCLQWRPAAFQYNVSSFPRLVMSWRICLLESLLSRVPHSHAYPHPLWFYHGHLLFFKLAWPILSLELPLCSLCLDSLPWTSHVTRTSFPYQLHLIPDRSKSYAHPLSYYHGMCRNLSSSWELVLFVYLMIVQFF